jgi:hypothetical protein
MIPFLMLGVLAVLVFLSVSDGIVAGFRRK